MATNSELLDLSMRLVRLEVERQMLQRKLIVQQADLQDFEVSLFKLCISSYCEGIIFFRERKQLLEKLSDDTYCDGVYSEISNQAITFFDYDHNRLIQINFGVNCYDYSAME